MKKLILAAILALLVAGCTKEDEGRQGVHAGPEAPAESNARRDVTVLIGEGQAADAEKDSDGAGTMQVIRERVSQGAALVFPRAVVAGAGDAMFVLDRSGFVKKFSSGGALELSWELPRHDNGTPTGITIDREGSLLIADTHNSRVLVYSGEGKLLRQFGTYGTEKGQFTYVTDVIVDSEGSIYTCDYGQVDCVQKFTSDGTFVVRWTFDALEGLGRPMALARDANDHLYVADSCNHRVVKFDTEGNVLGVIGRFGKEHGAFKYPYDVAVDADNNLYVCEYGNARVQKFSPQGEFLAAWGKPGRDIDGLWGPWGIDIDSKGGPLIADTYNQRILRLSPNAMARAREEIEN
jgi:DNA-binding beta-propeller fold protein YncE